MAENLERIEKPKEQAESTLKEQGKPTSKETKDLPSEKTYTQGEYSKAQSAWEKQVKDAEVRASDAVTKATATAERLQSLETELGEARTARYQAQEELAEASDDPDKAKKALTMLRKAEVREADLTKREFKLTQDQAEMRTYAHTRRGEEIVAEYKREFGIDIPINDVLSAKTDEGMVNVALKFALAKSKEAPKEPEEETSQFDAGISSAGGQGWERVRAAYIKNPYDPETRKRYLEMRSKKEI